MSKKWFDTGYLKSKPNEVDHERGIISGVKVCSAGEAKGHGVYLDAEFISTIVAQGAEAKQGLKARFGHPNMCSSALGTFIGRFKNFRAGTTTRDDGSTAECCFADLFLSNSAKETPNGDLYSYLLALASDDADMFGTSIVFTPGAEYRKNEKGERVDYDKDEYYEDCAPETYVECEKLHACDCVDEPAANDGLFSAFAKETPAGLITDFLDQNPAVFDVVQDNPEVLAALAQYGDKMDEFLTRYQAYRNNQETPMSKEENASAEVAETETEELEAIAETAEEVEAVETEELETSEEPEVTETEEAETLSAEETEEETLSEAEPSTIDLEEFNRTVEEFGAEIAAQAFGTGGDYQTAKDLHYAALAAENEQLKEARASEVVGASPAEFGEDKGKKLSMVDIISGAGK